MIEIRPSAVADTRTCDYPKVTRQALLQASVQHIEDVRRALDFFDGRFVPTPEPVSGG